MATRKASKEMSVVIPTRLLKAARSRSRPDAQPERGNEIRSNTPFSLMNNTVRNYRTATNITDLIRHLARAEGPFSNSVHNFVQVACTNFTIAAWDVETQQFSPEGTLAAMTFMAQLDTPYNYDGFTLKQSIAATVQQAVRETILTGGISGELVLDKAQFPSHIQIVGMETLTFVEDGKGGYYPTQRISGQNDPVDLNIPSFFVTQMLPDPDMVVPRSMMESALKVMLYFEEFLEDIRRSIRIAGHNRQTMKLDTAMIKAAATPEVQKNPIKLQAWFDQVREAIQRQLEEIEPDQAFVHYDSLEPDVLQSGTGTKIDYTPMLDLLVGQYSTGMKTPPSVLGLRLSSGSQGTGSVETMVFLKTARALQEPAETFFSRVLTLGARLYGQNVTVSFKFDAPDLRPDNEQQAFHTMKQTNILTKLSYGLLSDDEAANMMGCFPRPPGAPDLSGTMFMTSGGAAGTEDLPTFPGDTAQGRDLQPPKDAPRKAGGKSQ